MDVSMLLCDAATVAEGKLYIHGGGWSILRHANFPTPMALGIKVGVPWDQTNERHQLTARLLTADGEQVEVDGEQVMAQGDLEVGRPVGLKPGTPIDAPIALGFGPLALPAGGYVWELEIDGEIKARAPFRVMDE